MDGHYAIFGAPLLAILALVLAGSAWLAALADLWKSGQRLAWAAFGLSATTQYMGCLGYMWDSEAAAGFGIEVFVGAAILLSLAGLGASISYLVVKALRQK